MLKKIIERIWLLIFAHPRFIRLNRYFLNLAQKSLGVNNYQSDEISGELFWCRYVLQHYPISVLFDIGAHKGDYVKMFREAQYSGQAFLFEPHPSTFSMLAGTLPEDGNTFLYNIGFSDQPGKQPLFDHSGDSGSPHASLFSAVITDLHGTAQTTETSVQIETLDQFAEVHGIKKISLLKIDTEGNEFKILRGASRLLLENRIDLIQFEFGEMNVISRVFFKDFYDLLAGRYRLYRLLPGGLLPLDPYNARQHEIFHFQNIVAVNRNLEQPR